MKVKSQYYLWSHCLSDWTGDKSMSSGFLGLSSYNILVCQIKYLRSRNIQTSLGEDLSSSRSLQPGVFPLTCCQEPLLHFHFSLWKNQVYFSDLQPFHSGTSRSRNDNDPESVSSFQSIRFRKDNPMIHRSAARDTMLTVISRGKSLHSYYGISWFHSAGGLQTWDQNRAIC